MRRYLVPALMMLLLLTGCGEAPAERRVEERRDAFAAAELGFTAAVTVTQDDEVFRCTLECVSAPEALTVTVTAPENVAGVTAQIRDGETAVEYEGVRLSVGAAGETGLHPISAVARLCEALRRGHVIRAWAEGDETAAEIFIDGETGLTVWFSGGTLTPCGAEFARGGAVAVRCELTNFQIR